MSDHNSVVLVGRLTRDPDLKYTPQGAPVCEMSLASNRRFTKKDGEKVEGVLFVDLVAWGRLAETAAEYLKKGRQVVVLGSLTQDRWQDKETGQKRSKIRVQVQTLQFLGGGSKDEETSLEDASSPEVPAEESVVALAPVAPVSATPVPSRPAPAAPKARPAVRR